MNGWDNFQIGIKRELLLIEAEDNNGFKGIIPCRKIFLLFTNRCLPICKEKKDLPYM